ncbi:MAG: TonB-dependent receptor [Steroidobacteraceae bacterium]
MSRRLSVLAIGLFPFALSFAAVAADAPDDLDEIVVTARLIQTPLSHLPASASVLDARVLEDTGVAHFGDVLGQIPNLGFAGGTSRPRYFQIRGIGELEQYEGAPNPSVGFLIDDIDFSGIAMPASLFDLARAEVLRGPQGTTYGANALAGLISLRSQAPQPGFAVGGELEAGDYGSFGGGLVLNNSLGESTAWRLALHRYRSDGFRHNAFLDRDDTNGIDESLARLKLHSALSPDLTLDATLLLADSDNGYDAWSLDNSRITQSDRPGVDQQRSRALALAFDYTGWQGFRLRSVTTLLLADSRYAFDGDWGNDAFWGENGPYDFYETIGRERRNFSQELRLSGGTAATRWVTGLYALRLAEDYDFLDLDNGAVSRQLASNYRAVNAALYGQVDHDWSPALSLSAGLRLERRDARYRDSNQLAADPVDNMVGGHLALTWHAAEGRDYYAALTRGYKAGGINTGILLPPDKRTFDPESLWNAELGLRTRSAAGHLESQTSLFYMRRGNQQVSSSVQADPADPLTFILLTDNAARGENYGLESQWRWQALPALTLGANAAWLHARFLDYTLDGRVLDGRAPPHAPQYQLGLWALLRHPDGWFARVDWQASDGFYFGVSDDERAPAWQLANLRLGYETGRWSASLWVRNLFNEQYAVRGFFFGNEPPDWTPKRYIQNGDPRQWGVKISYSP